MKTNQERMHHLEHSRDRHCDRNADGHHDYHCSEIPESESHMEVLLCNWKISNTGELKKQYEKKVTRLKDDFLFSPLTNKGNKLQLSNDS